MPVFPCGFYWLSTKPDLVAIELLYRSSAFLCGVRHARRAPRVKLRLSTHNEREVRRGNYEITHVILEKQNPDLVRLKISRGKAGNEIVLVWQDNDVSFLPEETREITATYRASQLGNEQPYLEVKGWNAE